MKKLLLTLGTIATIATPVAVVVSCGSTPTATPTKNNDGVPLDPTDVDAYKSVESIQDYADTIRMPQRVEARSEMGYRGVKLLLHGYTHDQAEYLTALWEILNTSSLEVARNELKKVFESYNKMEEDNKIMMAENAKSISSGITETIKD